MPPFPLALPPTVLVEMRSLGRTRHGETDEACHGKRMVVPIDKRVTFVGNVA